MLVPETLIRRSFFGAMQAVMWGAVSTSRNPSRAHLRLRQPDQITQRRLLSAIESPHVI